ncbi:MAG: hypothetical protein WBD41_12520 [Rhodococcus sp. (in: high G+C Gram-positive bacteria)]|uniref:hypothetical protein n=1 Tax=Rhodococcus sp. EPR-157 TaxID=1813677 RepID=UPI0007BC58A2|nr:hypothetical protein [Rhodococcus sp. EPR-157]KZF06792.1 hypothetical protein A2J03_23995 [Rhodococcus sp. EPR-157]
MGELLGADLDELRSLGAQLRATANELADVVVPARTSVAAVVMPDAGIDDVMGRISTTFETTAAKHSTAVQTLADGAISSAATYEAVEDAFSRQLSALTEGLGR